jgi:AraC family transcriptional regulator
VSDTAAAANSGRRGFVGAPGAVGVIGDFRLPARRFEIQRIDAPTVTALIVDLERDFPVSGVWYSADVHYFDMSLIPRPAASKGCFEDVFEDRQTYGKVFLVPAGYRLRGEGPECLQNSLNVFVQARPIFPDEPVLGEHLAPLLRECLRLKGDKLRQILDRIAAEVAEPRFASSVMIEGLGMQLLAEAARALHMRIEAQQRQGGLPLWRLKLIEHRIRDGASPPSVAELAGLCGLSRRQLTRAFHHETGRTISAFINELTFERARRLVVETDLPIAAIGAKVGFATASAFGNAFRRATGQSPREFRAKHRRHARATPAPLEP